MIESGSARGFEMAEALEPALPRSVRVSEVVGTAAYLRPSGSASATEVERSVAEVSEAADCDRGILREAHREAERQLSQGRCTQGAVALLLAAWRQRNGAQKPLPGGPSRERGELTVVEKAPR